MVETALPKIVDRFDLGYRAELHTARKTFTCRVGLEKIIPGEQYYSIIAQHGVTPWPMRVRPENLDKFWKREEARREVAGC
jgi:hypothetical protein